MVSVYGIAVCKNRPEPEFYLAGVGSTFNAICRGCEKFRTSTVKPQRDKKNRNPDFAAAYIPSVEAELQGHLSRALIHVICGRQVKCQRPQCVLRHRRAEKPTVISIISGSAA